MIRLIIIFALWAGVVCGVVMRAEAFSTEPSENGVVVEEAADCEELTDRNGVERTEMVNRECEGAPLAQTEEKQSDQFARLSRRNSVP